jgi:hypothetical protein
MLPLSPLLQDCQLYVMDACASVTIDDCKNCHIIIGPTESRWLQLLAIALLDEVMMAHSICCSMQCPPAQAGGSGLSQSVFKHTSRTFAAA